MRRGAPVEVSVIGTVGSVSDMSVPRVAVFVISSPPREPALLEGRVTVTVRVPSSAVATTGTGLAGAGTALAGTTPAGQPWVLKGLNKKIADVVRVGE